MIDRGGTNRTSPVLVHTPVKVKPGLVHHRRSPDTPKTPGQIGFSEQDLPNAGPGEGHQATRPPSVDSHMALLDALLALLT